MLRGTLFISVCNNHSIANEKRFWSKPNKCNPHKTINKKNSRFSNGYKEPGNRQNVLSILPRLDRVNVKVFNEMSSL